MAWDGKHPGDEYSVGLGRLVAGLANAHMLGAAGEESVASVRGE